MLRDRSPQCVHIDSSSHSHPPGPLQRLTFILNTKGVVLGTGNRVAVNSHVDSSRDWLFTAPFAAHGCPAHTNKDPGLGPSSGWKEFISAVRSESAEIWVPHDFGHRNILLRQRSHLEDR